LREQQQKPRWLDFVNGMTAEVGGAEVVEEATEDGEEDIVKDALKGAVKDVAIIMTGIPGHVIGIEKGRVRAKIEVIQKPAMAVEMAAIIMQTRVAPEMSLVDASPEEGAGDDIQAGGMPRTGNSGRPRRQINLILRLIWRLIPQVLQMRLD
jgi:hypothetical protein